MSIVNMYVSMNLYTLNLQPHNFTLDGKNILIQYIIHTFKPKWNGRTRMFEVRNTMSATHNHESRWLNKFFMDLCTIYLIWVVIINSEHT